MNTTTPITLASSSASPFDNSTASNEPVSAGRREQFVADRLNQTEPPYPLSPV